MVISPTLSLIHDQVEELCAKGITATYLCSTQNDTSIPAAISRGEFKVVYITPERIREFVIEQMNVVVMHLQQHRMFRSLDLPQL